MMTLVVYGLEDWMRQLSSGFGLVLEEGDRGDRIVVGQTSPGGSQAWVRMVRCGEEGD
jgi:hypothetical protein